MLDPDTKPHPAREIGHHSKGCLAVLVALAVLIAGGYFVYDLGSEFLTSLGEVPDYTGAGKKPVTVVVPEGASLNDVGDILLEKDVIKSVKAWDNAVKNETRSTSLQAGSYAMKTQLPAVEALRILLNPTESRVRDQVTVAEGLRLSQQVAVLAKGTKIKKADYDAALMKPQNLGLPAYAKNRPEGFLFPDTYEVTGQSDATTILKQMTGPFTSVTNDIELESRAQAMKRDPYDLVVIASIIEGEVKRAEDRPKVARVIYNRMAKKQKLEMNSTVDYAVGKSGKVHNTDADLKNKSPYNTYVHAGLPPGPINAPGKASLEAATDPATGKWLYFVTINPDTGETLFANTAKEHSANIKKLDAWCAKNKGKC